MARVCLIYPRDIALNFFPLGIGYVASYLKSHGHDVTLLDLFEKDFHLLDHPKVREADIVGLSITTPQLALSETIVRRLKSGARRPPIVVGGIHPSYFMEKFLEDHEVDYLIYGEGEVTMNELANAVASGVPTPADIAGLIFRRDGEIIANPPRTLIPDLNALPYPARDLVNFETYFTPPGLIRGLWTERSTNLTTSRGCPGRCTYCGVNYIFNKNYRRRSVDNVMEEIESLIETHDIDGIYFMDDTFLMNQKWIEEFAERFRPHAKRIIWSCYGRVDTVTEGILKAIASAGCVQVEYGIETGSSRVLAAIKKNTDIERIKKAVRMTKANGIRALGSFIFGFADDTEEDLQASIDLARELDLDFSTAYYATPYPASEIYAQAVAENRIIEKDMSRWYVRNNDIWRVNLSPEVLAAYRSKFLRERRFNNTIFFFRSPKFLFRLVFFALRNIPAFIQALRDAIRSGSFDDLGYYFYVHLSGDTSRRHRL